MNERRTYSAQLKFQIALQALSKKKATQEIAREYGINVNLITKWKNVLEEKGAAVFETKTTQNDSGKKLSELENIIGKKEIEIQLLKKYLGFYARA